MLFTKERYVTACQQLLVTAVVGALGVTAAGVATLDIVGPDAATPGPSAGVAVERAAVVTASVRPTVREVALGGGSARRSAAERGSARAGAARIGRLPVVVTSAPERVGGYATVGAAWARGVRYAESAIALQVRSEHAGSWSAWQTLPYHDDHAPGSGEDAAHARPGTDPLVVGRVEAVQLRVATADGAVPRGLAFALVDPGSARTVNRPAAIRGGGPRPAATGSARLSAMAIVPRPQIFSRAQWGADESLREQGPPEYGTIETGFIHHTVDTNDYTRSEVPALIRGIYAFHVKTRGWRDIGYNFLVDRFGRIWEGRAGGVDRAVVGAHTLGYNAVSFAMSAIGNFDIAKPPQAVLDAYARLFAWKLSLYGIPADASGLTVEGTTLHAINGHRDVNQTVCPGRYLYADIPSIRTAAAAIQRAAQGYDPTQPPAGATAQPSGITFPARRNVTGSAAYPELVLQSPGNALSVLSLGRMTGFAPPVTSAGTWSGTVVAAGDLDGDGRGDVLTRSAGATGWSLHRGLAGGRVAPSAVDSRPRLPRAVSLIPAGDWTGDGRADLLGVTADHQLLLYAGRGDGSFHPGRTIATEWRYPQAVVAGDLDRDGRPDLVALSTHDVLERFPAVTSTSLGARVAGRTLPAGSLLLGGGDYSGDGVGDLGVRDPSTGAVSVLLGDGHGRFRNALGPFTATSGLRSLTAANLTRGSRPDLLGVTADGALQVLANNEHDNVRSWRSSARTTTPSTQVLSVGDWNGDGVADVITRQQRGDQLVLNPGVGGGRFGPGVSMSRGWTSITRLAAVGDITGDGRPDLVGRTAAGVLEVFPGDGGHGFARPRLLPSSLRTFNLVAGSSWRPGDFPASAYVSGDGSFVPYAGSVGAAALRRATGTDPAGYDAMVGVGDVTGDGRADLLARQRSDGTLWLIPGTAHGFGERRFVAAGLAGYRIS